jgi:hypothetical protein
MAVSPRLWKDRMVKLDGYEDLNLTRPPDSPNALSALWTVYH